MPFYASWEEAVPTQSALKSYGFVTTQLRAVEKQNEDDVLALPVADQDAVDTLLDTLGSVAANIEAIVSSRVDDSLINEIRRRPLGPPPGAPGPAARVAFPVPARRPLDPEGPDLPPAAGRARPGVDWFGRPVPEAKEEELEYSSALESDIRAGSRDDLSAFSRFSGATVPREGSLRAISEGSRTRDAFPPRAALAPRTRAKVDEFDVDPEEIVRGAEMGERSETARLRKLLVRAEGLAGEPDTTSEPFAAELDPRAAYLENVGRSPRFRSLLPERPGTASTESEEPSPRPSPARSPARSPTRNSPVITPFRGLARQVTLEKDISPFLSRAPVPPPPALGDYIEHFRGVSAAALSREGNKLAKAGYEIEVPPPKARTEQSVDKLLQRVAEVSLDADQRYLEAKGEVRPGSAFAPKERPKLKGKAPKYGESVGSGMCGGAQASALPTSAKVGTLIDRALRMLKKMDFRIIPVADLEEIKAVTEHIRGMVIVPGGDPALATIQAKVMALLTQLDVKVATHRSLIQVGSGFGYLPAARTSEYIGPVMEAMPRRYM